MAGIYRTLCLVRPHALWFGVLTTLYIIQELRLRKAKKARHLGMALQVLHQVRFLQTKEARDIGMAILELSMRLPANSSLSLVHRNGNAQHCMDRFQPSKIRAAIWLHTEAVMERFAITVLCVLQEGNWIGARARVRYGGRQLGCINTRSFHISFFEGRCQRGEVKFLETCLELPEDIAVVGFYSRDPQILQTSLELQLPSRWTRILGEFKCEYAGLEWYHTTKQGTRFHIAL